MAISKKLTNFLKKNNTKYKEIEHKTVYTAFDKSQTLGVPEKIIGKTLVVKMNGDFGLVLLGANKNLDKKKFKKVVNKWRKENGQKAVKKINFATERWMKKNLKGVKVGTTPPFGILWGLTTFAEKVFLKNRKIIVSAGDYNFSIEISSSVLKKSIPDLALGSFAKKK